MVVVCTLLAVQNDSCKEDESHNVSMELNMCVLLNLHASVAQIIGGVPAKDGCNTVARHVPC